MSLTDQQIDELARKAEGEMKFAYNAAFFNEAVGQINNAKKTTVPSWIVPSMVATLLFAGSTYMIYQINTNTKPTAGNYDSKELPIQELSEPVQMNEDDMTKTIVAPIQEKATKVIDLKEPVESVADQTKEIQATPEETVPQTMETVKPIEATSDAPVESTPIVEEKQAVEKDMFGQEKGKGGKKSLIPVLGEDEENKKPSAFDEDTNKVIPPRK